MAKIKLTKGELKRQRDALKQYERYLPTLQLKKQQLQIEILHQLSLLEEKRKIETAKREAIEAWVGLLTDKEVKLGDWLMPREVVANIINIAGINLPVFDHLEFVPEEYDLFITPPWVDSALEALRLLICLRVEISVIEKGIVILKQELRVATQRVNLFEKVKIPQSEEAIRLIKIYIGDQMTNAVGRSKIAKRKIEEAVLEGVAA
ncbi:V-type ATP synthase subunit D [bacterium]|nr:MAG: V-type ATP synthase subunit D [bacterium]